jgi:hypothetical protein
LVRRPAAISYEGAIGFLNGAVFVTEDEVIWISNSLTNLLGRTREVRFPRLSIRRAEIGPREPHRGFAIPVRVATQEDSYVFYIGRNTLSRANAEAFVNALNTSLRQRTG